MAHQAHNLPWITLASHVKFVRENKHITPHTTDLFATGNSSELNDVNHFMKKLTQSLNVFAITERSKYPSTYPVAHTDLLFASAVLDESIPWIGDRAVATQLQEVKDPQVSESQRSWRSGSFFRNSQLMQNWITLDMEGWGRDNPYNEVIAFLIDQGQLEALLRIAQCPSILTGDIFGGNYVYHYEWTACDALLAYVVLNVILSKPELCTNGCKAYMETRALERVMCTCSEYRSGQDLAHIGHRRFLGMEPTVSDAGRPGHDFRAVFDPLADIEGLRKWMKHCFNVMVRYEVFEREAGREPCWEEKFEMMFVGKVARAFGFRDMELDKDSRAFFKSARKI
jgi:hypothetical protein